MWSRSGLSRIKVPAFRTSDGPPSLCTADGKYPFSQRRDGLDAALAGDVDYTRVWSHAAAASSLPPPSRAASRHHEAENRPPAEALVARETTVSSIRQYPTLALASALPVARETPFDWRVPIASLLAAQRI